MRRRLAGVGLALWAIAARALAAQDPRDAAAALLRGEYDRAITAAREAAAARSPQAARLLVQALAEVGRYPEARRAAEEFLAGNPGSGELWGALGEVRLLRGDLREADSALARALALGTSDSLMVRLQRAVIAHLRGAHDRAASQFGAFIGIYNRSARLTSRELTAVAMAVQHLGARDPQLFKDALRAYDLAIAADSTNLEARVRLGELFLDKYNGADAQATFEGVLRLNPRHPGALLGLARTRHFDGSDEALRLVRRSLDVNPSLAPARAFLGTLRLELEEYDTAEREARRALEVNPASLEALAVLAAAQFFRGDTAGFEATRRRVLALNPRYADLYTTLAELSARIRRYDDAAAFARRAVELDSTSWRGHALLGRNQLRLGTIAEGARALERAFRGDPYDVWTKNTLDLLDTLRRYPETASPRFRLVVDARESELLALYAADLAEEAYDRLAARYGYRPRTPIRVEIYPNHADFSVRTVGLVGLGALGVSFGPVVVMDSPSARERGEFNWGATLWHEIAHTFHLGMSDHRVPRWLTEGLAVLEERRARPGWGNDVTPGFLLAFLQGRLLPVGDLNRGFTRPVYPEQVLHSYYQASLACELIEEEHGAAALRALLAGYREGAATAALFRRVLGRDLPAFDAAFASYVRHRFAGPLAALQPALAGPSDRPPSPAELLHRARADANDFVAQLATGRRLLQEGDPAGARPFLERARVLFPQYGGNDSPYWYLAQIAAREGDIRRAAEELAALVALDGRHYPAMLELAELRDRLGDPRGAVAALEAALYVSPFEPTLHERLAALHAGLGNWEEVVRERRAVLALGPVDRAEATYQVALAYFRAGRVDDARRAVLAALERAPNFERAQDLLLQIHAVRSGGRP